MASVLALLSKSFFETRVKVDGRTPEVGDVAPIEHYLSSNKRLTTLDDGGSLYLVTVRPPDEQLLLVAVLRNPVFEVNHWSADANVVKVTDITDLIGDIELDNGKGITAKPGRLGMSLQTPRVLSDADVVRLDEACGSLGPTVPFERPDIDDAELDGDIDDLPTEEHPPTSGMIHLNAHDRSALPCLCKDCLDPDTSTASTDDTKFVRDHAIANGRVLYYWLPEVLVPERDRVRRDVEARMRERLK